MLYQKSYGSNHNESHPYIRIIIEQVKESENYKTKFENFLYYCTQHNTVNVKTFEQLFLIPGLTLSLAPFFTGKNSLGDNYKQELERYGVDPRFIDALYENYDSGFEPLDKDVLVEFDNRTKSMVAEFVNDDTDYGKNKSK